MKHNTFIHIPKTAGSSAVKATKKNIYGHDTLSQHLAGNQDLGYVWTIVRNPYDRALSLYYFMRSRIEKYATTEQKNRHTFTSAKDPNDFWCNHVKVHQVYGGFYMRPQSCFLSESYTPNTEPRDILDVYQSVRDIKSLSISSKIKQILRFETIQDDWEILKTNIDCDDLPYFNKTDIRPSLHWSEELTDETITLINDLYAQDFEELGYDMITKKKVNSEFEAVSNINMMQSAMQERQKVVAAKYRDKVAVKNDKVYPKPSGENLFIHIPKAAGSSIWATTGMKTEMHKELKFMTKRVKPDTFVFACIRNPYDRAVSLYYYLKSRIRTRSCRDWNAAMCCLAHGVDVNEFWLKFITQKQFAFQCRQFPMMRPQTDFLEDQKSVISTRIDKILKVENLKEEWEELRAIRGFKPLAKRNVGRNRAKIPWKEELNPETIEHLSNLYDKDFKCLPYNKHNAY